MGGGWMGGWVIRRMNGRVNGGRDEWKKLQKKEMKKRKEKRQERKEERKKKNRKKTTSSRWRFRMIAKTSFISYLLIILFLQTSTISLIYHSMIFRSYRICFQISHIFSVSIGLIGEAGLLGQLIRTLVLSS